MRTKISAGFSKVLSLDDNSNLTDYRLTMAKNESESCVISILSDTETNARFEITKTNGGFEIELEKEYTIEIEGVNYPDPLVPLTGGATELHAGEITNILVRFTTGEETRAGKYEFIFSLIGDDESVLFEYIISVKVWDFALPMERRIKSTMGLTRGAIARAHNIGCVSVGEREKTVQKLYLKYYDILRKNRVSAYDIPYDILDPRADEYMSDPRVTCFRVSDKCSEETLRKHYEKLAGNPVWQGKAFFYPIDEPRVREHLDELIKMTERIHAICPGVKIISPFFKNLDFDDSADQVEIQIRYLDIICPKLNCWNDDVIYKDHAPRREQFGVFADRMKAAADMGRTIWQYVCWEPGKPYVNLYINEDGLDHRILFWQQHMLGATGFLYWCANWWGLITDPWTDMATVPDLSPDVYGDGSLLYNGDRVGIDGACSSVRLESVRDGLEDAEMLAMAEKILGKEWLAERVKSVTADLTHYTESTEHFISVRESVGDAIEAALVR